MCWLNPAVRSLIVGYLDHAPLIDVFAKTEGTPDQVGEWLLPAMQMKIFGCLAQTELGHGSNVRGLLTTATYDPGMRMHSCYLCDTWRKHLSKL